MASVTRASEAPPDTEDGKAAAQTGTAKTSTNANVIVAVLVETVISSVILPKK